MNFNRILVAVLAISLAGSAVGQRGSRRDTVSGRSGPTIAGAGNGSPNWDDNTGKNSKNRNFELSFNEKLADKLKTLLPEGVDAHAASKGFGDLKDFVSTVRAANNLTVPFNELKQKMADGSSKELQKAIHELKPDVDAKAETKKAGEQARQDIKESKQS